MYTILKLILYPHSLLFKFIYCVMELRPYQQEVFDLINSNNQYYFQLPCGTGKNIIISEYINRYPEYRYAVFSPSIYLANEMCRLINRPVNRIFSDKGTEEEYDISICVYNSWTHLKKRYDILFVDEAHHFQNGAHDIHLCKIPRKYLFSATLINSNYIYHHDEAVNNHYIVDFNMNIHYVDRIDFDKIVNILETNQQYKHIIAYCNTKISAVFFSEKLKYHGITSACVHSSMTRDLITKNINDFKEGKIRVLVNCYLINEGVDIKICDCALFVENRNSKVQIIQCIGRMQRLFEGKNKGNFICFLDETKKSLISIKRYLRVINDPNYFKADKKRFNLINNREDQCMLANYKRINQKILN